MPADSAYVDTSVLGAYYCPEPLSSAAEAALLKVQEPCISALTEVEFASLIARKRRLKELGEREAKEVLRLFGQHVAEGYYRRLPLGAEHLLRARDLIASMASALSDPRCVASLARAVGRASPAHGRSRFRTCRAPPRRSSDADQVASASTASLP